MPLLALGLSSVTVERGQRFAPRAGTLVYPGEGRGAWAPEAPLMLLDGTWRASRAMLGANPWLLDLPRLNLPPQTSGYALRRAHRPGQLSTLEAALAALARVEGDARRYQPLYQAFERFVAEGLRRAGRA